MSSPAGDEWRLIRAERRPGPAQIALDEVAARTAGRGGPRTVRVYEWDAPGTLSLGYAQDADAVDWKHCERAGVDVTRRRTGGGAIYHDAAGDIAYAVAVPADELPESTVESYHRLLEPVFDALAALGVDARLADERHDGRFRPSCYLRPLHAAHDVVVEDGGRVRKLAGSAQYRTRDAVLQHGSLSFERTPERHARVFADGPDPAAFEARVAAIEEYGVDRGRAVAELEGALGEWAGATETKWTDAELDAARDLADEKYRDAAWVRDAEAPE